MQNNLTGKTLGKYELRDLLGVGGMGAVYRAYDHSLRREVAVKIINLGSDNAELRTRFIREAQTAAGLEHSHIVRVYDFGIDREINYVVMQFLTGGSLSERIKQAIEQGRPRASLSEVALLLEHLSSALDYAHAQNVVHRDIKPQNIMFNNQGQAFIVDFGIAKLLTGATNLTGTNMAMGTPSYMPPEQWTRQDLTPAADQYALGITAYQLVAGRLPFEADSVPSLWYKIENEQPTPLHVLRPDVPQNLMLVLGRAMAKKAEERFPNCTQFSQAFSAAVSEIQSDSTHYFTFKLAKPRTNGGVYTPTPSASRGEQVYSTPNMPKTGGRRGVLVGAIIGILILAVVAVIGLSGNNSGANQTPTAIADEENSSTVIEIVATEEPSLTATDTVTPTDTPTHTITASPEPTATATNTATDTPTETPAPTITNTFSPREAAMATLDTGLTLTATAWTPTHTPNYDETVQAEITSIHYEGLTATATLWTPTPTFTPTFTATPTLTDTPSPTPTLTPTATLTATPTLTSTPSRTPDVTAVMQTIHTLRVARNSDWQPVEQIFDDGVTMVLVPAGCFTMGDSSVLDQSPAHEICFDSAFWLDKTEVTQADFDRLGGLQAGLDGTASTIPVHNVTWFEARDFCLSRDAALPTEAQWEYVARGVDNLLYPWGDIFVAENAVYNRDYDDAMSEVGLLPVGASWVGALDLSGNLFEWTSSLYTNYPYNAGDGREKSDGFGDRVARGGSWIQANAIDLQNTTRTYFNPEIVEPYMGFRCARSLSPLRAMFTVTSQSVNLRRGPGTSYAVAGTAQQGETFPIIAQHLDWYLVETPDGTVWVSNGLGETENPSGATIEPAATIPATPVVVIQPTATAAPVIHTSVPGATQPPNPTNVPTQRPSPIPATVVPTATPVPTSTPSLATARPTGDPTE